MVVDEVHSKSSDSLYGILNTSVLLILAGWPIILILMSANIETSNLIDNFKFKSMFINVAGDSVMREDLVLSDNSSDLITDIIYTIALFKGTFQSESNALDVTAFDFSTPEEREGDIMIFLESQRMIELFKQEIAQHSELFPNTIFMEAMFGTAVGANGPSGQGYFSVNDEEVQCSFIGLQH